MQTSQSNYKLLISFVPFFFQMYSNLVVSCYFSGGGQTYYITQYLLASISTDFIKIFSKMLLSLQISHAEITKHKVEKKLPSANVHTIQATFVKKNA